VSLYMGMRQTSNLDQPEQFLLDLEKCFFLLLPGLVPPNRVDYFRQFIRRRTALAIKSTSATPDSH
ncbi:MAG: TetR/AcrR family transcriptional regulator, partial [Mycobacterium sp.]